MQNFEILLQTSFLKENRIIFFFFFYILNCVTLVCFPFSPGSREARPIQRIPQRTLWTAHQLPSEETLPPGLWDHVTGGRPVSSRDCLCAGKELALWPEFSQPSSLSSLPGTRVVKYAVKGRGIAVLESGSWLALPSPSSSLSLPSPALVTKRECSEFYSSAAESIGKHIFPLLSWNKVKQWPVYPACWSLEWP